MGDADIIPIGTSGRPGRGAGKSSSGAARNLAGGSKAKADSPSAKKPTTSARHPVAGSVEPNGQAKRTLGTSEASAEALKGESTQNRPRPAIRTEEKNRLAAVPVADWISAFTTAAAEVFGEQAEPQLARFLAFLRHRITGDYEVDEYGFDPQITDEFFMAALRPIAEKWFRVEVIGEENIPTTGGALVVSNHSGTVPVDGLMTMASINDLTGRHLRPLGADLVFQMPLISALARKGGATLACQEDAERMLSAGELVGVWPEGFKGIGKPFSERYKLQRFGRGGFVSAAMRTGVPIVPLSVVGAEEIYPLVGNIPSLAKAIGVPYLPITPTFPLLGPLGLVPLPSKWLMEFGEPIRTDAYEAGAAEDPMLVFNVTDQVRETIQQTLYALLRKRGSVFGG